MRFLSSRRPKVAISIPCPEYIHVDFTRALMQMHLKSQGKVDHVVNHAVGYRITINRNNLVDMAKESEATHLLFIDADMIFPPDAMIRLLSYDKDIVCATTCKRDGDPRPIGRLVTGETAVARGPLVEFALVGFPFMLLKTTVFDKLAKPYFAEPPAQEGDFPEGEDTYFCRRAREAGFQVWVDVPLSQQMGHIGHVVQNLDTSTGKPLDEFRPSLLKSEQVPAA